MVLKCTNLKKSSRFGGKKGRKEVEYKKYIYVRYLLLTNAMVYLVSYYVLSLFSLWLVGLFRRRRFRLGSRLCWMFLNSLFFRLLLSSARLSYLIYLSCPFCALWTGDDEQTTQGE